MLQALRLWDKSFLTFPHNGPIRPHRAGLSPGLVTLLLKGWPQRSRVTELEAELGSESRQSAPRAMKLHFPPFDQKCLIP